MLSPEQVEDIKKQLHSQLEQSEIENKEAIKSSIREMDAEQLESFLSKNNLIKKSEQECIFCSIIDKTISAYTLAENQEAIAVLEINPISKAHSIIIPKLHSENVPKKAFDLAEELSKKISKVFNPKKIEIVPSSLFGHEIINVLPVYTDENIHSKKQQANPKELAEIQKQLQELQEPEPKSDIFSEEKLQTQQESISDKNTWLPKRIP